MVLFRLQRSDESEMDRPNAVTLTTNEHILSYTHKIKIPIISMCIHIYSVVILMLPFLLQYLSWES